MSEIVVWQKPSCGTCKKAIRYLTDRGIIFTTRDIGEVAPSRDFLDQHVDGADLRRFLNSRSALYRTRGLGNNPPTKAEAIALMIEDPNLIRRPIIMSGDKVVFGFSPEGVEEVIS